MNICIDQGNSRTKVALFADDGKLVKALVYKSFTSPDVERLFSLYPLSDSIVSSVEVTQGGSIEKGGKLITVYPNDAM